MLFLAAIGWRVLDRIRIGPIVVSPHGLGIAAGFLAGGALLARRAERSLGIAREHIWNMLMWSILGVIVGARAAFVIGHPELFFPDDPLSVLRVWEGGVALYGGIFGGILAAIPYQRRHRLPTVALLDAAAPGFPLGIAIGRIGDLIIGDHLGSETSFILGYRYLGGDLPDRVLAIGTVVHQTALYDMLIAAIIFPIVLRASRKIRPTGHLIAIAGLWYAAGRFITDFARTEVATVGGLRGTQWTSLAIITFGLTWLTLRRPSRVGSAPDRLPREQISDEPEIGSDGEVEDATNDASGRDTPTGSAPPFSPSDLDRPAPPAEPGA